SRIQRLLLGQMQSEYFPVSFRQLGARIEFTDLGASARTIEGVVVSHVEQTHPGRSFAYSFVKNGTKIVYATDSELDLLIENRSQSDADPEKPRIIPKELLKFYEGADILIADGQYTDEEYPKKIGWGHARATTVVDLAVQAQVKQIAIYHHDPMHSDEFVDAT